MSVSSPKDMKISNKRKAKVPAPPEQKKLFTNLKDFEGWAQFVVRKIKKHKQNPQKREKEEREQMTNERQENLLGQKEPEYGKKFPNSERETNYMQIKFQAFLELY